MCCHFRIQWSVNEWWMNYESCFFPDASSTEQQELFVQKLQQCSIMFDFLDSVADLKSKETKRATLTELVEYVSTNRGVLVEPVYPEITSMVSMTATSTELKCHLFDVYTFKVEYFWTFPKPLFPRLAPIYSGRFHPVKTQTLTQKKMNQPWRLPGPTCRFAATWCLIKYKQSSNKHIFTV